MIKKLRKKITAINLSLASIILFTALLVTFFIGWSRIQSDSERRMMMVVNPNFAPVEVETNDNFSDIILIEIYHNDNTYKLFSSPSFAIEKDVIADSVLKILEDQSDSGYVLTLRCKFIKQYNQATNTTRIAMLDGFARSGNYGTYLFISVCLVLISVGCFFAISMLLAKIVLQPVEDSLKKQTQFVADASHELKTPLSIIIANTDIVTSHPNETVESQMKWLEASRSESQRMAELVSNLLFLTKNDSGLRVDMQKVNFSDCIGKTALGYDAVFYEAGKIFNFDVSRDVFVYGNEQQLRQLVTILLDNANKYSTGVGNVLLNLVSTDKQTTLTISNDSQPLTDDQLQHIFDRFYTLDTSHNKSLSGNGIGLAIAQTICQTHEGKITADYRNNRTTFTVTLPVYDSKKAKKLQAKQ